MINVEGVETALPLGRLLRVCVSTLDVNNKVYHPLAPESGGTECTSMAPEQGTDSIFCRTEDATVRVSSGVVLGVDVSVVAYMSKYRSIRFKQS